MPIYEYACTSCDHDFELLRPMSRMDEPTPCPECSSKAKRQISMFASYSIGAEGAISPVGGGGCCGGSCGGGACSTGF